MPTLRFRAEPSQANNLRVRVYSQDRTSLLATVTTGITESIANSGSYSCTIPSLSGYWYVLADFIDTGEVTSDGFASQWVPEVVDYLPPSSGLGQNAITIAVQSSSQPVPNSQVTISKSGTIVAWGSTSSGGSIVFALDAGTYTVLVQPPTSTYTPLAVQTLVVTATATVTYTLTAQTISPPATPGLSTVRFLVLDGATPIAGVRVSAELEDNNSTVDTALLLRVKHSGVTDASGICDLLMVQRSSFTRGGVYKIAVADSTGRRSHERRVTVPSSASLYAEDLPDA